MSDLYPSPATEPGTLCPCTPDCTTPRGLGATYAQGHDLRAAARLCAGLGLTAVAAAVQLVDRYGSVGAADRAAEFRTELTP